MADLQEAAGAVKRAMGAKEDKIPWQIGYLGNGAGQVYTSRENWLLVRYPYGNSPAVPVYCNANVPVVDGMRVKVGYLPWEPGVFQVISLSDQRIDGLSPDASDENDTPVPPGGGNGYAAVGPHWVNHMYLGIDSGRINWRQISPLGVFPTYPASLSVQIMEGYIPRPGTDIFVTTQTVDLTSHLPASGARYALISYDATGTVVVTDGAINAGGFGALTAVDIPATPAGNWRSCGVVLYPSQTAIREDYVEIDFYDLRFPEEQTAGSVSPASIPLANTHILVGNGSGVATDVAMSNDATLANTGAITLKNTGPGATGPLGGATVVPVITIDAQGRVTGLTSTTITGVTPAAHQLDGALHTVSGLTPGYILTALTASTFGFAAAPTGGVPQIYNETQTANGTDTIYYLASYASPGTIRVYVNGVRQVASDDVAATDQVVFSVAPLAGSVLLFDYELELA